MKREVEVKFEKLTSPKEITVVKIDGLLDDLTATKFNELFEDQVESSQVKNYILCQDRK